VEVYGPLLHQRFVCEASVKCEIPVKGNWRVDEITGKPIQHGYLKISKLYNISNGVISNSVSEAGRQTGTNDVNTYTAHPLLIPAAPSHNIEWCNDYCLP
jgi:hypothetical protein